MPDAEPDPRPTSWYRIPGPLAPGARRLLVSNPSPAGPAPQAGQASPAANADGPAPRWPLITQRGQRNIPVVGPTEALGARAGGSGGSGGDTPSVPLPAQPAKRDSGWMQAQRAWQDSGRDWETVPGRPPLPGPRQPDAFARTPYGSSPYTPDPYAPDSYGPEPYASGPYAADGYRRDGYAAPYANGSYAATPYAPDVFAPDPYAVEPYATDAYRPDEYQADDYLADEYPAGQHAPSAYAAAPHVPDADTADQNDNGADDAAPPRPAFRASRFDREDRDATRVDFGMPYRPPAVAPARYPAAPPAARFQPADPPAEDGADAGRHAPDRYRADRDEADAARAVSHRPGSPAPRFDREDFDATRVDFGMPYRPPAATRDPDDRAGQPNAVPQQGAEPLNSRYAAAPVIEDAVTGVGLWPVQSLPENPEPRGVTEWPDDDEGLASDDEGPQPPAAGSPAAGTAAVGITTASTAAAEAGTAAAGTGEDWPVGDLRERLRQIRADRAALRWPDSMASGDGQAPPTLRYARQPPPLPRRTPQRGPGWDAETGGDAEAGWDAETPSRMPGRPAPDDDDRSGHVRLPSGPAPLSAAQFTSPLGAAQFAGPMSTGQFTAPASPSESDELFRAWQGSVREAAGPRTRRPAGQAARRRRAWQVARIGVPAVVIVSVGAGALLMLTGRANEMLAERSSTGTARTGQATSTTTSVILAGYPGTRGGVKVAAMWSASGTIVAVGMADGHPAIWRRGLNGGWSLVSAADLGTMSGHLTSVAQGPDGWIAVGSVTSDGMAQPMVYTSADGVTWRTVPSLTAVARGDAQFLGVAAGRGGYLVVGREGSGKQKFAQLWWSRDLANWTAGGNSGYHNSLAIAAAADGGGFVAAGSQADCHTIWTSPDGTHWTTHDVTRPAGAQTATLRYAAAGRGGTVVAAGFATNHAGGIPIVVTTDPGGARITQVVLPTGGVPGVVTGVTATGSGFLAAGMIGPAKAQRAVTWTSADGLTWSAATPVSPATGTTITALTSSGGKVTGTFQRGMDPAVQTLPAS